MKVAIILMLALLASPVSAAEIEASETASIDALEKLVTVASSKSSIQSRLERFLRRKACESPAYYAKLIDRQCTSDAEKKRWASKLVIESRGNQFAVSPKVGAVGPWQLHPMWCKAFRVSKKAAREPERNLSLCMKVFKTHLSDHRGNLHKAELAYSGGSSWYPKKVNQLMQEV